MNKKPIVSIIIPTLNEEKYILSTLKSLNCQSVSRKVYEIIVSDSSSTDQTVKLARKMADKVIIVPRVGAGFGRNQGVLHARGKYLAFVDADTCTSSDYVKGVIEALEKNVAATGPFSSYDAFSFRRRFFYWAWNIQVQISTWLGHSLMAGFNMAVRKKVFEELNGFISKDALAEDIDFSLRVSKKGSVCYSSLLRVSTSSRRMADRGILFQIKIGLKYLLFNQVDSWKNYRSDFKFR